MLKRSITYKTFDDEPVEVTENFYFNISEPEMLEMRVEYEGGMPALLKRIIEEENEKELIKHFKQIILLAYGKRSDDNKRFIKNQELRDEFAQSAAYQVLFMELATNDKAAAEFLKGAFPANITKAVTEAQKSDTPTTT